MTNKRFTYDEDINEDNMYEEGVFLDNGELMETGDILKCLNAFYEENEQFKQLIHTMLRQIDVEKINTEDAVYSARIVFTGKEFQFIRGFWND